MDIFYFFLQSKNDLYTCFCVNTTCLRSSSAPFSFRLPGTSWSSVQTGVTCFTTSPPCDSRRSEGESGGEHALTTSHVELKQEKESPFLRQFRNVKDVSVNYERIDVQRVGSAI